MPGFVARDEKRSYVPPVVGGRRKRKLRHVQKLGDESSKCLQSFCFESFDSERELRGLAPAVNPLTVVGGHGHPTIFREGRWYR